MTERLKRHDEAGRGSGTAQRRAADMLTLPRCWMRCEAGGSHGRRESRNPETDVPAKTVLRGAFDYILYPAGDDYPRICQGRSERGWHL